MNPFFLPVKELNLFSPSIFHISPEQNLFLNWVLQKSSGWARLYHFLACYSGSNGNLEETLRCVLYFYGSRVR